MALRILLFITIMLAFICAENAVALSVDTHRRINEHIAEKTFNGFSLNTVLVNRLGLSNANEQKFNGRAVKLILGDGGVFEDLPPGGAMYKRSSNHFHNPINNTGFSGAADTGLRSGMSAISWALSPRLTQTPDGFYSWADARMNYAVALTHFDKDKREAYFAETFRGLGQLMHLVSDMSVPEHTRDDGHYLLDNEADFLMRTRSVPGDYEQYLRLNPGTVTIYANAPVYFGGTLSGNITQLFDAEKYNGTNPYVTTNTNIGLSEYANANFFSEGTITYFNEFTYPSMADTELWIDPDNNTQYLRKWANGAQVEHLAAVGFLFLPRLTWHPFVEGYLPITVNDVGSKVYADYASLLIPRAIGYSADMLKYFFRGDITIGKNASGEDVIKNSSGDALTGTFTLYSDDASGNRHNVGVVYDDTIAAKGESAKITVTTPTDHTPAEPGKYMLVFKGNMGGEEGAVAASVVVVNPPKPYVFIIQNTAEINTAPVETISNSAQLRNYGKSIKWDALNQFMSGEFKAYGEIKKIRMLTWDTQHARLSIDGVEAAGGLWQRDANTSKNPKVWKIYADPAWPNSGTMSMRLEVTMSDGVYIQDIFSYYYASKSASKSIAWRYGCGQFYLWSQSVEFVLEGALRDRFKVDHMASYTAALNKNVQDCYNIDYQNLSSYDDARKIIFSLNKSGFIGYEGSYYDHQRDEYFLAYPMPEYPVFTPSAKIDRVYSEAEEAELKAKGITPERYSIIFK